MPSGAKKRKAAKKKKENKASTSTTTLGNEDFEHCLSDGGHNSQHHLTDGEEEEAVEKREWISSAEGDNSVGNVQSESERVGKRAVKEESAVHIERELKLDAEFDNKKGSSSSGSSTSSDDESRSIQKDIMAVDNAPVDIFEAVDSLSDGHPQVSHTNPVSKIDGLVKKASSDFGTGKVSLLNQKVASDVSASTDDSLTSEEIKLSTREESSRIVEIMKDLEPEHKRDELANAAAASDAKKSAAHESEDKLTESLNVAIDGGLKVREHIKDSESLGSLDGQPLVSSAPRPVQRTSCMSCCGLFEVFTGSNR